MKKEMTKREYEKNVKNAFLIRETKDILSNAEMIFLEGNFGFEKIRICIFGHDGDSSNEKILKRIGTSENELKSLLADLEIKIISLIHDDDCLHLTISNNDADKLGLEITE